MSPNDEFLDFGLAGWELGNLTLTGSPLTREMMPTSFVRAGFMRGLEHEAKLGVNPFKSGIIGSFDAHNSLPFVDEDNFFGKFPGQEPSPDRWKQKSSLGEGERRRGALHVAVPRGRLRGRVGYRQHPRSGLRCDACVARPTAPPALA